VKYPKTLLRQGF